MIFTAPWVLLALTALPLLWWLLRVTPPAPRRESFPAIRLLLGLKAREETPARTPWWLLLLRCIAAAAIIVGLAGPVLDAGSALPGRGPVLLVLDNGWASATGLAAADPGCGCRAGPRRAGRPAGRAAAHRPRRQRSRPGNHAADASQPICVRRLAAMHPEPWPVDRAAATAALDGLAAIRQLRRVSGGWADRRRRFPGVRPGAVRMPDR